MRIRLAVPDAAIGPDTLNAALEAVTRTNEVLLDKGVVPTAAKAIAKGIKWRPEPPGDEHFDHAKTVVDRGHGDCDDLAPYHAASLRFTGEDPDARAIVRKSGKHRWHAVVERSDGSIDDPSADAGMYEYKSPLQPRLAGPREAAALATKLIEVSGPGGGRRIWCARCDMPFRNGSGNALSGHGISLHRDVAASNAIEGALTVGVAGGLLRDHDVIKLGALKDLLDGVDPGIVHDQLYAVAGSEGVGFFKKLVKPFGKIVKAAANVVPIPGVKQAYDMADKGFSMAKGLAKGGKGRSAPQRGATPPRVQPNYTPRGAPTTIRKDGPGGPRIYNFY